MNATPAVTPAAPLHPERMKPATAPAAASTAEDASMKGRNFITFRSISLPEVRLWLESHRRPGRTPGPHGPTGRRDRRLARVAARRGPRRPPAPGPRHAHGRDRQA